tara:strand:+ start:2474 stop:2776 length:303 start_codon:yes stop_codon:yes gene_type:complete
MSRRIDLRTASDYESFTIVLRAMIEVLEDCEKIAEKTYSYEINRVELKRMILDLIAEWDYVIPKQRRHWTIYIYDVVDDHLQPIASEYAPSIVDKLLLDM